MQCCHSLISSHRGLFQAGAECGQPGLEARRGQLERQVALERETECCSVQSVGAGFFKSVPCEIWIGADVFSKKLLLLT